MDVDCGICCGTDVGDTRVIPGDKINHDYYVDVGDGYILICVVYDFGCSCHWDTAIVTVSKLTHVFNTTFVYANCWINVG